MLSRQMVALIAVGKRSKRLFGRKSLPNAEFCGHVTKDNFQSGHLRIKGFPTLV